MVVDMESSIKSVMVTGSRGFIGTNLVLHLLERYPHLRVCGVDRLDYNSTPAEAMAILAVWPSRMLRSGLGTSIST